MNDGYLSDVPTQRSASPDVSHDLIASTKALEQHFKEKYSVLRHAYEDRIKRMSDVINLTCKTLLSDEIIQEMKQDRASSIFVVSHADEIIDRHLESDREVYINELLEKISQQDILLRKKSKEILGLRESAARKEKEMSEKATSTSTTITQLQNQLRQKIDECEKLRVLSEQREQDINLLEHSFQQSAKELALIEGLDKKEQMARAEMKEQLRIVSRERQYLQDENYDLRTKLQNVAEEIDRLQQEREQRIKDEDINRQRISQLMEQVEKTLEQEANESNMAISTVHDKMKAFRNRLVQELQKERKLNSLLQEELHTIKTVKDDSIKDHRRLQEETTTLRSTLAQEQEKTNAAQQQLHTVTQQITTYKLQLSEWEGRCRQLEDRLTEQARSFQQELKVREEAARLEAKKTADQEQRSLEQKTAAYRLHYENELSKLSIAQQQQATEKLLRTSQSEMGLATVLEDLHLHEVIARMRYDRDEMTEQHRRAMEEHRRTMDTMRQELITRHQNELRMELRRQELDFQTKYEQKLADAQSLLQEAGRNIDKLKTMVKEGRSVIALQNQRIEHLKKEYDILQATVYAAGSVTSTSKRGTSAQHHHHHNHHRVAFGTTVTSSAPSSRHTTPQRMQKENQSFHANASVMDVSTMSMNSTSQPSSHTKSHPPATSVRTPTIERRDALNASTTVLASAETPIMTSASSTPGGLAASASTSTPAQAVATAHQMTLHAQFLQSQLDEERQRIQQLEATVAQLQGEAEFYQQQTTQYHFQLQDAQAQIQTLQQQQQSQQAAPSSSVASRVSIAAPSTISSTHDDYGSTAAATRSYVSQGLDPATMTQTSSMRRPSGTYSTMVDSQSRLDYHESPAEEYARQQQTQAIIDEAQEEVRHARQRCFELEQVIVDLRSQLDKAERASVYLNAQRKDTVPLTQQCGLLSPTDKSEQRQQLLQQKKSPFTTPGGVEGAEEHVEGGTGTDESLAGWTQPGDDAYTIPSVNGLVQFQEKLEEALAISKHWEERYEHQTQLLTVATRELQDERTTMQTLRKREHTLFTLLTKVQQTYRQQIHALRMDLDTVRSVAQSFVPFAANERLTNTTKIQYLFKAIFDAARKKLEADMKNMRIAMQSAHNTEISILESKFIEQVNALNQKHTKELEKMHMELLARTERAMNASMTATNGSGMIVTTSGAGGLLSSSIDASSSMLSNVSILSTMQDVSSSFQQGTSSTSATTKIGDVQMGHGPPAWESVLKGVLQGLRDQEAIRFDTVTKVSALSAAHQEPSFAANAAARALIGDDIDRFVVSILQKKYAGSPSTAAAAAKLGQEGTL